MAVRSAGAEQRPLVDPLAKAQILGDLRRALAPTAPRDSIRGSPRRPGLTTGLAPLDVWLGGGLPRGQLIELSGAAGGMSAVVSSLADATQKGLLAAVVDPAGALDARAAQACGAELRRVLWVRPGDAPQALRAADLLLGSACFPLVVLYLCGVAPPTRMDHAFRRLSGRAATADVALLVVTERPLCGPSAAVTVLGDPAGASFQRCPGDRHVLRDVTVQLSVARRRAGPPGDAALLILHKER